jgi:hypothetical protein
VSGRSDDGAVSGGGSGAVSGGSGGAVSGGSGNPVTRGGGDDNGGGARASSLVPRPRQLPTGARRAWSCVRGKIDGAGPDVHGEG